jgi:hypothetical protein
LIIGNTDAVVSDGFDRHGITPETMQIEKMKMKMKRAGLNTKKQHAPGLLFSVTNPEAGVCQNRFNCQKLETKQRIKVFRLQSLQGEHRFDFKVD